MSMINARKCVHRIRKAYQESMLYSFGVHFKVSKIPRIYLTDESYDSYLYYMYIINHLTKFVMDRSNAMEFDKKLKRTTAMAKKNLRAISKRFQLVFPIKISISSRTIAYLADKVTTYDYGECFNNAARVFDYEIASRAEICRMAAKPRSIVITIKGSRPSRYDIRDTRHISFVVTHPKYRHIPEDLLEILDNQLNYKAVQKLHDERPKTAHAQYKKELLLSHLMDNDELIGSVLHLPRVSKIEYETALKEKVPSIILPDQPNDWDGNK